MASKQNMVAVFSLLNAATVWGLVWYPYRVFAGDGVSGELATLLTYSLAVGFCLLFSTGIWNEIRRAGAWGLALMLAAGWTNLGYVLAMLGGEVMRVLLLFYTAPLWTVLLSRLLLHERLNAYGYAIILLSLCGAVVMLWRPDQGLPLPRNVAEWIGLSAGFTFAASNVLVRHVQHLSVNFKAIVILSGTALLTTLPVLNGSDPLGQVASIGLSVWGMILVVGMALGATSMAMQYGLTHLPANPAIILLMFELVVAAVSSYFLAGEAMGPQEIAGAVLIVAASLFSGKMYQSAEKELTS